MSIDREIGDITNVVNMVNFKDGKPVLTKEAGVISLVSKLSHYFVDFLNEDVKNALPLDVNKIEVAFITAKTAMQCLSDDENAYGRLSNDELDMIFHAFVKGAADAVAVVKAKRNNPG